MKADTLGVFALVAIVAGFFLVLSYRLKSPTIFSMGDIVDQVVAGDANIGPAAVAAANASEWSTNNFLAGLRGSKSNQPQ